MRQRCSPSHTGKSLPCHSGFPVLKYVLPAVPNQTVSMDSQGDGEQSVCPIVIGNPLMLSPDFPPLHTGRESFPSSGVPSSVTSTF